MIKYELDIKLPSLNDYVNKCRTHNKAGASMKRAVEDDICWQIKAQGVKKVRKPCKVHIHWEEKDKRRDIDNVISSAKFLLDSLVRMKVLPDDNQEWVKQIIPTVETSKNKQYKVMIKLEEIENVK